MGNKSSTEETTPPHSNLSHVQQSTTGTCMPLRRPKRKRQGVSDDELATDIAGDDRSFYHRSRKKLRTSLAGVVQSTRHAVGVLLIRKIFTFIRQFAPFCDQEQTEHLRDGVIRDLNELQSSDSRVLWEGWKSLLALTHVKLNKLKIPEDSPFFVSALATVVRTMMLNQDSAQIQRLGCHAIQNIITPSSESEWDNNTREIISLMLNDVVCFADNMDLQGMAITTIAVLIRLFGQQARKHTLNQGGLKIIVKAMKLHANNGQLFHAGSYALHQIGFERSTIEAMNETGMLSIVFKALRQHALNERLVNLGLCTIMKLLDSASSDDFDHVNNSENMAEVVLDCMELHEHSQSIQGTCFVLVLQLAEVCSFPKRRTISSILKGMVNFQEASYLQFFCCGALRDLLSDDTSGTAADILYELGGVECILRARRQHGHVSGMPPMVLLILAHLWESRSPEDEAATLAFGGGARVAGEISLVFRAMG